MSTGEESRVHFKVAHESAVLCGAEIVFDGERGTEWTSIPKRVQCPDCEARLIERYLVLAQQVHDRAAAPFKVTTDLLSLEEARELAFGVQMLAERLPLARSREPS